MSTQYICDFSTETIRSSQQSLAVQLLNDRNNNVGIKLEFQIFYPDDIGIPFLLTFDAPSVDCSFRYYTGMRSIQLLLVATDIYGIRGSISKHRKLSRYDLPMASDRFTFKTFGIYCGANAVTTRESIGGKLLQLFGRQVSDRWRFFLNIRVANQFLAAQTTPTRMTVTVFLLEIT